MTRKELCNFTLANGNRNVLLEKLMSIDMLCNHSIKLNCDQVMEVLVPAEMCTIVLFSARQWILGVVADCATTSKKFYLGYFMYMLVF